MGVELTKRLQFVSEGIKVYKFVLNRFEWKQRSGDIFAFTVYKERKFVLKPQSSIESFNNLEKPQRTRKQIIDLRFQCTNQSLD